MTTTNTVIEACACKGRGCVSCDGSGMREAAATVAAPEHTVECTECSGFGCCECGMRGYHVADLAFEAMDAKTDRLIAVSDAGHAWMARAGWSFGPGERRPVVFPREMMIAAGQREWIAKRSGLVVEVGS